VDEWEYMGDIQIFRARYDMYDLYMRVEEEGSWKK
jgi:hypothetical protein